MPDDLPNGDVTVSEVCVAIKASPPLIANVNVYWPPVVAALKARGIASRLSQIGMAATIDVETEVFKPVVENLNYSAAGLMDVWPARFPSRDLVEQYARQPEKIANYVYANRNGNGPPESGEGWRFRGRGLIQLTGRENYAKCGKAIGADLVAFPERLLEAEVSAEAAAWFWEMKGCAAPCELVQWHTVRRLVNGGLTHVADFEATIRGFGLAA